MAVRADGLRERAARGLVDLAGDAVEVGPAGLDDAEAAPRLRGEAAKERGVGTREDRRPVLRLEAAGPAGEVDLRDGCAAPLGPDEDGVDDDALSLRLRDRLVDAPFEVLAVGEDDDLPSGRRAGGHQLGGRGEPGRERGAGKRADSRLESLEEEGHGGGVEREGNEDLRFPFAADEGETVARQLLDEGERRLPREDEARRRDVGCAHGGGRVQDDRDVGPAALHRLGDEAPARAREGQSGAEDDEDREGCRERSPAVAREKSRLLREGGGDESLPPAAGPAGRIPRGDDGEDRGTERGADPEGRKEEVLHRGATGKAKRARPAASARTPAAGIATRGNVSRQRV